MVIMFLTSSLKKNKKQTTIQGVEEGFWEAKREFKCMHFIL